MTQYCIFPFNPKNRHFNLPSLRLQPVLHALYRTLSEYKRRKCRSVYVRVAVVQFLNVNGFHNTWYQHYDIGRNSNALLCNFLRSLKIN